MLPKFYYALELLRHELEGQKKVKEIAIKTDKWDECNQALFVEEKIQHLSEAIDLLEATSKK